MVGINAVFIIYTHSSRLNFFSSGSFCGGVIKGKKSSHFSRQNDTFSEEVKNATEHVLTEVLETHKNLIILSQNTIADALNDEELDLFKKANLALRFLSLMKGKDDIEKKSSDNLTQYIHSRDFGIRI